MMEPKKFLIPLIVIAFLVLVLFGVGGYFLKRNGFKPAPTPTAKTTASPSPSISQKPSPSVTVESKIKITIASNGYNPIDLTVSPGTEVVFLNNDSVSHTVTAENRAFDSGEIKPNSSFSYEFNKEGSYSFYCKFHPDEKGKVTVK